jgi:hypothetical protein
LRYYGVYLFVPAGGTAMDIAEEGTIADGGGDTTLHSFPVYRSRISRCRVRRSF